MSVDRGMGTEEAVLMYRGLLISSFKKDEIMPFGATWMQPEIISEVSHSKNIF